MMTTFPDIPGESSDSVLSVFNPSNFDLPVNNNGLEKLFRIVEKEENVTFSNIELVYVDEESITEINEKYLDRDYVTDIISFSYNDNHENGIEGTLYCCAPRIAEQSSELGTDADLEFYRIFVHGLLHLVGYSDSTTEEKEKMTTLENHYLERFNMEP